MNFVFVLLHGVMAYPRALQSADLVREIETTGLISSRYTLCPHSNANRCYIKTGRLFSRKRCEWLNYREECTLDGSNMCFGYFDNLPYGEIWLENVRWKLCDESVIEEVKKLFPGVTLDFDKVQSGVGRSCLPTVWSGPETCDPVLEKGDFQGFQKILL